MKEMLSTELQVIIRFQAQLSTILEINSSSITIYLVIIRCTLLDSNIYWILISCFQEQDLISPKSSNSEMNKQTNKRRIGYSDL